MHSRSALVGRLRVAEVEPGWTKSGLDIDGLVRVGAGRVIRDHSNLIVDQALGAIAAFIAGAKGQPTVGGDTYLPLDLNNPPSSDMVHDLFVTSLQVTEKSNPSEPSGSDTSLEGTVDPNNNDGLEFSGNGLNITYPSQGTVVFAGVINETERKGETFTEEGLITRDGTLFARTLIAQPATGSVTFDGGHQPSDGETVTIHDGIQGFVFEFDDGGGISAQSDIAVSIGTTVIDTLNNFVSEVNGSGLNISAVAAQTVEPQAALVNTVRGAAGNQQITTTGANISVSGMSGGRDPIEKTANIGLQFEHTIKVERIDG